jgi:hypothetical protein
MWSAEAGCTGKPDPHPCIRRPLGANQSDRRESPSGIRRLFQWRSTRSIEISKGEGAGSDTWLTEVLQRASRPEDEDYQDFAPKRA